MKLRLLVCLLLTLPAIARELPEQFELGTNLSGIADWSTELPWRDLFKTARSWISQKEGEGWGKGPALQLDERGWITRLEPGCYAETPLLTAGHRPAGDYVCLFDGRGVIEFWNVDSQRLTAPGRIEVRTKDRSGLFLRVRATDPAEPIRNIRFVRAEDEATFRDEPWDPAFLRRWDDFPVIRFMDWMSTNGSQIATWADRPRLDDAIWTRRGVPLEMMLDYCNRIQANPWFCMPHLADDDYVRRFAQMVKERLDPRLTPYLEYSNEVWNYMFPQTRYALEQGRKLQLSTNDHEAMLRYFSQRTVECFRIWEEVFGSAERFVRVMAVQVGTGREQLTWRGAARQVDALAYAPYFGGQFGDPRRQNEIADWSVDELLDACRETIEKDVRQRIQAGLSLLRDKAVVGDKTIRLVAYEAGQHLVGHGGAENNQKLEALFHAANRHPRMRDLYLQYIEQWRELGGGLLCNFSSVGRPSKWGSWGVLEAENQDPATAPKFQALLHWVTPSAPVIMVQPVATTAYLRDGRGTAVFTIKASGTPPPAYQWHRDGQPLAGATGPELTLPVTAADAGAKFRVEVTNDRGQLLSDEVTLRTAPLKPVVRLVDFDGAAVPDDKGALRRPDVEETRQALWEFGLEERHRFWARQPIVGGLKVTGTPARPDLRTNDTGHAPNCFALFVPGGENVPSAAVALLMWRRADFPGGGAGFDGGSRFSYTDQTGHGELRFVIAEGERFWLSEESWQGQGTFVLENFHNSAARGHRWAPYHPTPADFAPPVRLPAAVPVDFRDVRAVGVLLTTSRTSWSHGLEFTRFIVDGVAP